MNSVAWDKLPMETQVDIEFAYDAFADEDKESLSENIASLEEYYNGLESCSSEEEEENFKKKFADRYEVEVYERDSKKKKRFLLDQELKVKNQEDILLQNLISNL